MPFSTLFTIAVALAMDAFAVALASGICLRTPTRVQALRMAFTFGIFQAAMPVVGWVLGLSVRSFVETWGSWIAFALLALVGAKMLWEGSRSTGEPIDCDTKDPTRGKRLILLALATSIDALAVGLSFSLQYPGAGIGLAAVVIGAVCFAFTGAGMWLGRLAGRVAMLSRYAELLGGATLISVAVKTLLQA